MSITIGIGTTFTASETMGPYRSGPGLGKATALTILKVAELAPYASPFCKQAPVEFNKGSLPLIPMRIMYCPSLFAETIQIVEFAVPFNPFNTGIVKEYPFPVGSTLAIQISIEDGMILTRGVNCHLRTIGVPTTAVVDRLGCVKMNAPILVPPEQALAAIWISCSGNARMTVQKLNRIICFGVLGKGHGINSHTDTRYPNAGGKI